MARCSFNLAQAKLSDSEENDKIDSADDIVSCHNDPDSDCDISENDQSGDNSSS